MGWPKGVPRSPETIAKMKAAQRPLMSLENRYWMKVDVRGPDECWPWTAATNCGYGKIGIPGRWPESAHRIAWLLAFGPIPGELVVDHDCHNRDPNCPGGECAHRACQNPLHLCLKTRGANVLAGKTFAHANAVKTHCDNGHLFDEANTYIRPSDGWRDCRKCKAETQRRYLARKAAQG